jgi:hypothetical protein
LGTAKKLHRSLVFLEKLDLDIFIYVSVLPASAEVTQNEIFG